MRGSISIGLLPASRNPALDLFARAYFNDSRYAIRSARSCGFVTPAKLIFVPLANACGLFSQTFRLSGVHFSSFFAESAGENWYPGLTAMFSSMTPYRFGPIL